MRRPNLRPVFWEAVLDLGAALWSMSCYIPPVIGQVSLDSLNSVICSISGSFGQFCFVGTFAWYSVLVLNTWYILQGGSLPYLHSRRAAIEQHAAVWAVCFACSLIPLGLGAFGPVTDDGPDSEGVESWVPRDHNPYRLFYYVPCAASLFLSAFLFIYVIYIRGTPRLRNSKTTKSILFFLLVFLCYWIGPLVVRILELSPSFSLPDWWDYQLTIRRGSTGIVNFLVWCSSPMFRKHLPLERFTCCNTCCKKKRRKSILSSGGPTPYSPINPSTWDSNDPLRKTHALSMTHGSHSINSENPAQQRLLSYYRDEALGSDSQQEADAIPDPGWEAEEEEIIEIEENIPASLKVETPLVGSYQPLGDSIVKSPQEEHLGSW